MDIEDVELIGFLSRIRRTLVRAHVELSFAKALHEARNCEYMVNELDQFSRKFFVDPDDPKSSTRTTTSDSSLQEK